MCGVGSKPSSARSWTPSSRHSASEGLTAKPGIQHLGSIVWITLTMWILLAVVVLCAGCGTTAVHHIARATKLPEEARGFLRVVQDDPVLVGIVGDDEVSEKNISGYLVVHEQDLAQLIRNTEALIALRAETRRSP